MLSAPPDPEDPALGRLRELIDRADEELLHKLSERLELVRQIVPLKRQYGLPRYAPGREAKIMRRLASSRPADLPIGNLLRMWRELLAATVALEGRLANPPEEPFAVAVYEPPGDPGLRDLARDHYGSHVQLHAYTSSHQVIQAVNGDHKVGVLPLPQNDEAEPWWRYLLSRNEHAPRVIARLPFGPRGNARTRHALVIGYGAQRKTEDARGQKLPQNDRTLFVIENVDPISPDKLVTALSVVGLTRTFRVSAERPEPPITLIELEGFVPFDDPRLDQLCEQLGIARSRVLSVGGYAVPLPEALEANDR